MHYYYYYERARFTLGERFNLNEFVQLGLAVDSQVDVVEHQV